MLHLVRLIFINNYQTTIICIGGDHLDNELTTETGDAVDGNEDVDENKLLNDGTLTDIFELFFFSISMIFI